jgi:hypothetical protein
LRNAWGLEGRKKTWMTFNLESWPQQLWQVQQVLQLFCTIQAGVILGGSLDAEWQRILMMKAHLKTEKEVILLQLNVQAEEEG